MSSNELVLVTGASGFLALHVVKECLKQGYKVRGTVRDLKDDKKVGPLRKLEPWAKLELIEADLLDKSSWEKAMRGVDYVIHVASPFPGQQPKDEDEVIKPALEGTVNVMNAAHREKVKRFIYTSSTATLVGYEREKNFTENDWPEMDRVTRPYVKSKILAEKATWDFVESKRAANQECFDLVVINPSFILGIKHLIILI
jgi:nucleoside-diphosphate-sugar epimerase